MGYCSYFSFALEDGPEDQYRRLLDDIDRIMGSDEVSVCGEIYAKWPDRDSDMRELTMSYQDITVSILGQGDEPYDWWKALYRNGKSVLAVPGFPGYGEISRKLEELS